ncbi:hypothetical protein MVEG_03064 [Podila verticillata NRRL 6337]|nr:hypothetical protein MVEG_03064 [Podila verticillata NRRL 6337]
MQPRIFDPTKFDDLLVRFVVTTKQPFSIVKSSAFQDLLNHATMATDSQVKLPSNDTMATKTKHKYLEMEEQVIAMFTGIHKVSLTADGWTSPFQDDFLGVTAHWIDGNWTQKELVIGFEPLHGAHTGENLAEALVNVLERFHLGEKLQSITTDNASNMAKMVRDLVKHPKAAEWSLKGSLYHLPCLGHIINLAVQAMLGPCGLDDQPPVNDNLYPDDDEDDEATASAVEGTEPAVTKLTTLNKLRKGIVKIRASPPRRRQFDRICDIVKCPKLELTRDVSTRWNSTFTMVDRAIILKDAYQSMCQNEPKLGAYALEDDEWTYLEKLRCLLSQFETMTKTVSSSVGYPTINRAMSVYNAMIDTLEEFIEQETNPSLLRAAIQGKQKLLDYYSKTDSTPVYAVATAMDPRMRFDWWSANDWDEYIQISKDMVADVWKQYYKGKEGPIEQDTEIARQMKLYGIKKKTGELEEYVHEGSSLIACRMSLQS